VVLTSGGSDIVEAFLREAGLRTHVDSP
jgi:hypothetical protein